MHVTEDCLSATGTFASDWMHCFRASCLSCVPALSAPIKKVVKKIVPKRFSQVGRNLACQCAGHAKASNPWSLSFTFGNDYVKLVQCVGRSWSTCGARRAAWRHASTCLHAGFLLMTFCFAFRTVKRVVPQHTKKSRFHLMISCFAFPTVKRAAPEQYH